jgi:hypothetical protein
MEMLLRYQQQPVSLLTNHGKERVIAPVLAQAPHADPSRCDRCNP